MYIQNKLIKYIWFIYHRLHNAGNPISHIDKKCVKPLFSMD